MQGVDDTPGGSQSLAPLYDLHLKQTLLEFHHCITIISNPLLEAFCGHQKYILAVVSLKKKPEEKKLNKL